MTGGKGIDNPMPLIISGFAIFGNEQMMGDVEYLQQAHGIRCLHPGHLGTHYNVSSEEQFCYFCKELGPPIKADNQTWSMPMLKKVRTTKPTIFIVLVSRSSGGAIIPKTVFQKLTKIIHENEQ